MRSRRSKCAPFAPLLTAVFALASLATAGATVALEEDFESMTDGPLGGQNGWSAYSGTLPIAVDAGNHLGSRAADGTEVTGSGAFATATKPLGLPGRVGTLVARFEGYAVQATGPLQSHNSGFWLAASSAAANHAMQGVAWWYNRDFGQWWFDARFGQSNSNRDAAPGGFDRKVSLAIFIDRARMETWGTWDFGDGQSGQTARFPLTVEQIDAIDHAQILQDHRNGSLTGVEIDDITVDYTRACEVALQEDFESMTDGPLDGQNGWVAHPTALQMGVDMTNNLGTRLLDGLDTPARPPYEFAFATKPLALGDRFSRLTASFDGYAVQNSGGLPSHSSGLRVVATSVPANPGFGNQHTHATHNEISITFTAHSILMPEE